MPKIFKLRPKAVNDLENIYDYSVQEWGLNRAETYIHDLETTLQNLADNAALGRHYEHVRPNLRAFPVVSHVVYYKPASYGIAVIRVLHQSMDEKSHL